MAAIVDFAPEIIKAFSVEGRVAVITGAASGLGREAARLFGHGGAKVVLADIDGDRLEAFAADLRGLGVDVLAQVTDVSVKQAMDDLADVAVREFGSLDIWINSAGITAWASMTDTTQDEADRVVGINMLGTFWGCAAAGRIMAAQPSGGAIVNVSSLAGSSPVPALSVYGMTKAGIEQLTRVASIELGRARVRVNAIAPGWIDTPINASMYQTDDGRTDMERRAQVMDDMAGLSPLGLTGEPIDIALAMLYLASDASRFITGQTLRVTGGA